MRPLIFTLHFAPVTKKNSPRIWFKGKHCPCCGKGQWPFVVPSEAYEKYEAACKSRFPPELRRHICFPVNVRALYYMPSDERVDITNLHSALHDALVAVGVLADDSSLAPRIVAATDGSRVLVDRAHPRTEVKITSLEE